MAGAESQLVSLHATVVETACASEAKRQSVSVTSAGLISAGAAVAATDKDFTFVYMIIPVMIVSAIWFVTVRYYQQLAKSKWAVIHEIEERLPYAPFTKEWQLHKANKSFFTFGPSTLEQVLPGLIFCAAAIYGAEWAADHLLRLL